MPTRTGKRNRFDWAALDGYDNTDIIGVCLTQRQIMILKAALIPAYWSARWMGFPGSVEARDALDAMIAKIDAQLDGNDCEVFSMEFRDNPNDPCEVQYSNDGGDNWTTMFRKDICVAPSLIDIQNIYEGAENNTTNQTTYAGDITNIAPDWEYTGDPEHDKWTDAALCYAIGVYVDWACELAIAEIKAENDERRDNYQFWNDVLETLGVALVASVVAVASTNPAIITAVGYAVLDVALDLWDKYQDKDYDLFEDVDARAVVACWMYNAIRGNTPQYDTWRASLDAFVPDGDYEEAISEVVAVMNQSEDLYVNFLFLMNDVNDIAEALPVCDCPEEMIINQLAGPTKAEMNGPQLCHSTLLAYSNPGDAQAVCPAYYTVETDIYDHIASSIGGVGTNFYVVLPHDVLVTKVQVAMNYRRELETAHGDKNAGIWLGEPNSGGTYIGGYSWPATSGVTLAHTITVENVLGILPAPETLLYIHNSAPGDNGKCSVYWVHIECIPYVP